MAQNKGFGQKNKNTCINMKKICPKHQNESRLQNKIRHTFPFSYCKYSLPFIFIFQSNSLYSKTCLNGTLLGLKNLFSIDRCLVYTGSIYIDIL